MPTNQATIQTHPTGSLVLFTFNKLTFEKIVICTCIYYFFLYTVHGTFIILVGFF